MFQINFKEVIKAAGIDVKNALRRALVSQVKIPQSESVNPYRTLK
jgi:hypothetical protein